MIFMVALRKIKSLFCIIISLLQRCFCCFFRRKLNSDYSLPLSIDTSANENPTDSTLTNWDSWDGLSSVVSDGNQVSSQKGPKLTPLQQQIQEYRMNQQRQLSESSKPEEPNYFQDLAPSINQKAKIVIFSRPEEEQQVSNRVALSLSEPVLQSSELLEWTEDSGGGWEEESEQELNVDAVLREQKDQIRQERKAERLKRKEQKEQNKINSLKLATKLS